MLSLDVPVPIAVLSMTNAMKRVAWRLLAQVRRKTQNKDSDKVRHHVARRGRESLQGESFAGTDLLIGPGML